MIKYIEFEDSASITAKMQYEATLCQAIDLIDKADNFVLIATLPDGSIKARSSVEDLKRKTIVNALRLMLSKLEVV